MLSEELKNVREVLGFSSARSFYHEFLSRKCKLDFNYSYYMKIEGGRALPSPAIVSTIASTLASNLQSRLILAYCTDLFPKQAGIFSQAMPSAPKPERTETPKASSGDVLLQKQRYLTESQVACIARSREHYYLFLILTLARKPVALDELKAQLQSAGRGSDAEFRRSIADLESSKLAHVESNEAYSSTKEMKFPAPETESLQKLYAKIDAWNLDLPKSMRFEHPVNKMLIRRVSKRYHTLLLSQTQLIFDLLKASDEVQQDYNDEIIMLNFSVARGHLPG